MWRLLKRPKDAVSSAVREVAADEEGVGVVEIILILVVLISLVVIFKKQVTQIVKDILSKAASDAKGV
jgi:Flp pilus assembly pilin Flp